MSHSHTLNFSVHSDDDAIDNFANAMREKMALNREMGRSGSQTCPVDVLWQMLREHIDKGDPVDVANLAMVIHHRSAGGG